MSPNSSPVLPAKLNPPASPAALVARQAVCDRLCQAGTVRLVLVRAPAGFGKTTAMLQARARLVDGGVDTAWLTLDRADNDVPRLLSCLAQALAQLGLAVPADPTPLALVEALAGHDAPFTLFLDDFELIGEPAVLSLVREIVEHLPPRGRLVLGSRSLPELGLGRLRAAGQLLEIDSEDLRFSLADAGRYFALRGGQALAGESLARLHRKTEGWVAALWLASMALERHGAAADFIERFSGSDRAVADYLAEDVLAQQPAEIRDFLLRTSLLRQFDASLCQALNPRLDCAAILERLETAHLFLTPIDGEDRTWRYHSLFADFLRARLARERPGELARLHLAASGWYESQGRPVPAIDHALEGGDLPHALALMAGHAEHFLEQGRMRLLARWFAALPAPLLRGQPLLQAIALWAALFTRGPWEAMAQLEASGLAASADAAVRAHLNALEPMLLAMLDRHDEAYAVGRESLARLPTCKPFADSVLSNAMANVVSVLGQQHEAHRLLDAARRTQGGSLFNRMYTESLEGLLDLQEGRMRQASARFRMAVGATHAERYQHSHGNAWAGVLYAAALYEADQLEQAEHLLNVYLPLAREVGLPDHMIASHFMRARIAFQRGDIDAAFQVLGELEYLGHHRQLPRVVASAKLERARVLMLQGHGQAAREELARADDAAVWAQVRRHRLPAQDVDDIVIGRLRWELLFGNPLAAAPALAEEAAEAAAGGRHRRALKLRLLLGLAQRRSGEALAAAATLNAVLRQACSEGFVRLILDEGPAVGGALRRCAHALADSGTAAAEPIFADYLQRLLKAAGEPLDDEPEGARAAAAAPDDAGLPLEPLTRKEIRVLELLAEGYSNSAMAEKLFVSDSTVRTHLRNINMKLAAHSRTQAVAIARRLELIR